MLRRLCVAVLVFASVPLFATPASADGPTTSVDLTGLGGTVSAMVVDTVHHQVFVAGDQGLDVAPVDLSSAVHVGAADAVDDLALSPDSATLWYSDLTTGKLMSLDTATASTATPVARSLPKNGGTVCPQHLAVDGQGRVWFEYHPCASSADSGLGYFDPTSSTFAMHPLDSDLVEVTGIYGLANGASARNVLVTLVHTFNGYDYFESVDLATNPVTVHLGASPGYGTDHLSMSPNGSRISAVYGSLVVNVPTTKPGSTSARRTFDPAPFVDGDPSYEPSPVTATAFSADGTHLAAGYAAHFPNPSDVVSFGATAGDTGWVRECPHVTQPDALAWVGDDLLYVEAGAQPMKLARCDAMTTPQAVMTSFSQQVVSGYPFSKQLVLWFGGGRLANAVVHARRDGSVDLPDVTTDSDGLATIHDTALHGAHVYDLTYPGDVGHPPASTQVTITGANYQSFFYARAVSAQRTIDRQLTFHNRLMDSLDRGLGGKRLEVTRTDVNGTHRLPDVVTSPGGRFTITDTPHYGPRVSYRVTFPRDRGLLGATATYRVDIARLKPAMQISLAHPAIWYDQNAAVSIHLGRTYRSKSVTLSAVPVGGSRRRVLTSTVNNHGYLTASVPMSRNTTFVAHFGGDPRFRPRDVSVKELSALRPSIQLGGQYATSGKYKLFHADKSVKLTGTLLPRKPGRCLRFYSIHQRADGKWVDDGYSPCFGTNRRGSALAYFHPPQPKIGVVYGIGTIFNGDAMHTKSWSGVKLVKFTSATGSRVARAHERSTPTWSTTR